MKLRLRSFETKETLKIDVPSSCTLQQLKHRISQSLPSSSSNSIHVSLNKKDSLLNSDETLQSFGITSGDLIFFTFNPNGFSNSTVTPIPNSQPAPYPQKPDNETLNSITRIIPNSESVSNPIPQIIQKPENEALVSVPQAQGEEPEEFMEVDSGDMAIDGVSFTKSFSVPGFLRKVFTEELSDDGGRDHKLLVVALHAVFMESGFVILDPVSLTGSQIWKYWSTGEAASRTTLFYTLPEVIGSDNVIHTVELKFQCLSKFFIAHGGLSGGVSTRRVTLNEDQLVPFLNVVWANCGNEGGVVYGMSPEKEVFQFWRNVKDGLVLPLLIDLCEKAGLQLPPCFMRLPTDLKLNIVELLPGVDIAKVSCVSSELRYLTWSDDLWKKKFVEQFGDGAAEASGTHWKDKFVKSWETRKRRKLVIGRRRRGGAVDPFRFRGGPHPFGVPHTIGGDYDIFPPPFGDHLGRARGPPYGPMLNLHRHCS